MKGLGAAAGGGAPREVRGPLVGLGVYLPLCEPGVELVLGFCDRHLFYMPPSAQREWHSLEAHMQISSKSVWSGHKYLNTCWLWVTHY